MTAWAAFEAWVKINSEIFITVVPSIPTPVKNALMETKPIVERNGIIKNRPDRKSVLDRFWLLLKYGCNIEYDRGDKIWQSGERLSQARDSLVHYNVSVAPSIKASELWSHLEALMLLFIAPSTQARRTLLTHQFDLHFLLSVLHPLITEFEERPLHKGWARGSWIFSCPFDGVDEAKYPSPWQEIKKRKKKQPPDSTNNKII